MISIGSGWLIVAHAPSLCVVLALGSRIIGDCTSGLEAFSPRGVALASLVASELHRHWTLAVLLKVANDVVDLTLSIKFRGRVLVGHYEFLRSLR